MRLPGSIKRKIFGVILMISVTLILGDLVFGAGLSVRRSEKSSASKMRRQHSFSQPVHRFGFFDMPGVGEQQVTVVIQLFQPAPGFESSKPPVNGIYVSPRWVDAGYGVQVLKQGYWAEPEQTK
ncbi:MAG: hypothetical protein OEN50_05740 [Deltaproteobacteria bacterium]|nr:hypothetical protein [Deltaproteobacteria bacterium]